MGEQSRIVPDKLLGSEAEVLGVDSSGGKEKSKTKRGKNVGDK